ncbi:hypothetical protein [Methylobacterium nodulans]|uniref:hypothetical protein n=1 Tax=Methylobacterium nodulans TaxID=114616 RepID=UPI0012EDECD9|nr:hypothetical protein [Methylobacterium nodulans]
MEAPRDRHLLFDPEAGSLKSASAERTVPLHSTLLKVGFLEFVRGVGTGPLFPELRPDKFGRRGGNGTKIHGPWVRKLGITDSRIQPNHAWRHRFKTLARHHELGTDMVDAIVGHARRTVAGSYGEFPLTALKREIEKIPDLLAACQLSVHRGCEPGSTHAGMSRISSEWLGYSSYERRVDSASPSGS